VVQVTMSLNEQELAQAATQAQAQGLSVEEWLREIIKQETTTDRCPRDPAFGMRADDPGLADAIDEVVAARDTTRLRVS